VQSSAGGKFAVIFNTVDECGKNSLFFNVLLHRNIFGEVTVKDGSFFVVHDVSSTIYNISRPVC
jgi:hypothetical protein